MNFRFVVSAPRALALCAALTFVPHAFAAKATPKKTAAKSATKILVAGVDVTGLSPALARQRLSRELAPKLRVRHKLSDGKTALYRTRAQLGASLDMPRTLARLQRGDGGVPLLLRVDEKKTIAALRRLAPRFKRQSRDARVVFLGGKTQIVAEQDARTLNVGASAQVVAQSLEKNPAKRAISLRASTRAPRLTRERLRGIDARLSTYSTSYNEAQVKRTGNMKVAIRAIDGTLLSPGEEFSLNKTVGERTQKRGYRTTVIFQNGYKVSGIGGGVSQVTGTIFNAALLAALPISTYRTHSRPVAYIPLGRDATVSWGSFDMKFKNNTGAPVYIAYKIGNGRATATLFGARAAKRRVSLRVVSKNIGPREKKAQLFRTVRNLDGKVTRKERVGTSHYKWNQADWEAD